MWSAESSRRRARPTAQSWIHSSSSKKATPRNWMVGRGSSAYYQSALGIQGNVQWGEAKNVVNLTPACTGSTARSRVRWFSYAWGAWASALERSSARLQQGFVGPRVQSSIFILMITKLSSYKILITFKNVKVFRVQGLQFSFILPQKEGVQVYK